MPLGTKNGATQSSSAAGEKPVVFQKYFKNGNRTYASQVKVSSLGKKYLVLTEGHRDPETQELKKHTICVFEQDLKQFFAILQETVLYLRSNRDSAVPAAGTNGGDSVAGEVVAKPAEQVVPRNGGSKLSKPPITGRVVPSNANGNGARPAGILAKPVAKPSPLGKVPARPAPRLQSTPAKGAPKTGGRSSGR